MDPQDILIRDGPNAAIPTSSESRHDRRGRYHRELRIRDARAPEPLRAVTYLGPSGYLTYAAPHRFVGADGAIYRVKDRAQEGHGAEIIANRIAHALGVGPACNLLDVTSAALPRDGRFGHLVGPRVATVELDDAFNDEELRAGGVRLGESQVDWQSWATVIAFQTWIYAGDPQAVIRASDGRVFSIDHGACFRELTPGPPTGLVVPRLYGVSGSPFDLTHVEAAIDRIERISETDLLGFASGIPGDAPGWRMPIERRVRVVDWLITRQPELREVFGWNRRLS